MFPYLFLLNLAFVIYWLLVKKKWVWLSLIVMLMGSHHAMRSYAINFFPPKKQADDLKLMSYNVQLFGLYNWRNNTDIRDSIFDFLEREQPDVICFQEFFHSDETGYFETKTILKERLGLDYIHEEYTHLVKGVHRFGVATMSRFPIIKSFPIRFDNDDSNVCIASDILYQGDTLRIVNAHLSSIRLQDEDYAFMEMKEMMEKEQAVRGAKRIYKLLRRAFRYRVSQTQTIVDVIEGSPHPLVFCADINDSPVSYSYQQFRNHLKDAHLISGFGRGNTYIGNLPSFRIDYIFHDEELRSSGFTKHPEMLSDHHAISCYIGK